MWWVFVPCFYVNLLSLRSRTQSVLSESGRLQMCEEDPHAGHSLPFHASSPPSPGQTPISCRLAGRASGADYVLLCFCSPSTSLLIQYARRCSPLWQAQLRHSALEVRSLSELFFFFTSHTLPIFLLFYSISLLLFLGVSLWLSFSSAPLPLPSWPNPRRAPDWRVAQGWKAQRRGIQKQTTKRGKKKNIAGWERHCWTHTHTRTYSHVQAHMQKPGGILSVDTGHFREDNICSFHIW